MALPVAFRRRKHDKGMGAGWRDEGMGAGWRDEGMGAEWRTGDDGMSR